MKRIILSVILVAAVVSGGVLLTKARGDSADAKTNATPEAKPDAKAEPKADVKKDAPEEPHTTRDTNGNVVIKIDAETQKRLDLKIEPLVAAQMTPELKAYGRVADPSPLAALMTELASDQASYAASSNELTRLKTLSTSGNASARALQAAEAAALHDQLMMQSARDRLMLSWGRGIADQSDLPAFIQALTSTEAVLVRVDLAAGERLASPPAAARVVTLSGNSTDAQVLGAAMGVDPQTQGQGFILLVSPNAARLMPGEAVTGYLKVPGEPLAGVMIPREAVIRNGGKCWVYVATGEDHFTRKEVATDHPTANGWFVTSGVSAGEQVAVTGAQALLSAELTTSSAPSD